MIEYRSIKKRCQAFIKSSIRKHLKIRKEESFFDGIARQYYHIKKCLPHRMVTLDEFERLLDNLNINRGDVLIVHSAWRAMYMLKATPDEVLKLLLKKVGNSGTLVMPCYGIDATHFDVENTISAAGVLSELLRKYPGSIRSVFPKFSMVAYGEHATDIVSNHINSTYQFDENSPYYIAAHKYHAKILLIGLGKNPHKISVFHCASYDSRINNSFYAECYSNKKTALINTPNSSFTKEYIDRFPNYRNNKRTFKNLFKKVEKNTIQKRGLVLTIFNSLDAYIVAKMYCDSGGKIYKKVD